LAITSPAIYRWDIIPRFTIRSLYWK
jgi:hypothetical protein